MVEWGVERKGERVEVANGAVVWWASERSGGSGGEVLNLSQGERFWAGDWRGGGGGNARSRGPSGGRVGVLPEKNIGEEKCLAGRWMG